jgi:hypothetical protein
MPNISNTTPHTSAGLKQSASGVVLLAFSLLMLAVNSGCAGHAEQAPAEPAPISIESVRITAAGHYIDLRYRVLDPVAANELLGPGVKPQLTDDATGAVMGVPMTAKLGSLRQTRGDQRSNRSYFVLFANTAGVKPGSRVSVDMGGMRFSDLTIE